MSRETPQAKRSVGGRPEPDRDKYARVVTRMTEQEFRVFRDYIEQACSISLGPEKKYLIETRLSGLVTEAGCATFSAFFEQKVRHGSTALRDRIVDAMTTNETLWFRDDSPWVVLREVILPTLTRTPPGKGSRVRFWSAACSTGQEPYSMAMVIDDFCNQHPRLGYSPEHFEILASDISPSALSTAAAGKYDSIAMARGFQGAWESFRTKYFQSDRNSSLISPRIRSRVQFRRLNLQDPLTPLGNFDVVMLRYVAIYFADDFKRALFQRMSRVMRPGTSLFLGGSESVPPGLDWLEPRRHGRGIYYTVASTLA